MEELREQHRLERIRMLEEATRLEQQEHALEAHPSQGFLSDEYLAATADPTMEKYFPDTKNLKQEEAVALKQLEERKDEFKDALRKTAALSRKLKEVSANYEADLAAVTAKGTEELDELRNIVAAKEREVLVLERQFEESEKEVRRRFLEIDDAEHQLKTLRAKLADEKMKIKERIQKEFEPIIGEERTKNEAMLQQLEALKRDLELAVEYLKHDLLDVETSNAAMEESLRAETDKLVEELKGELELDYQRKESALLEELNASEREAHSKIIEEKRSLEERMMEMKRAREEQMALEQSEFDQKIAELNNECVEILTANIELKKKIRVLNESGCQTCPLLDRNIKKLEKLLVKMQIQDRDLALDGQNKKDMIHKFHVKPKLPPLPGKPI
jgi:hypothetical protein